MTHRSRQQKIALLNGILKGTRSIAELKESSGYPPGAFVIQCDDDRNLYVGANGEMYSYNQLQEMSDAGGIVSIVLA